MTLRPMTAADMLYVLGVRNDPMTRANSRTDTIKDEAWFHARMSDFQFKGFIADVDGEPVGYGTLQMYTPSAAEIGIALAPEARGKGLSHELIDALVEEGARRGIQRFLATVRGENTASLRAFLHEGFQPSKWVYMERRK